MKTLNSYTQDLLSRGKRFFSKPEAMKALGLTENQFRHQAYRLSRKKVIRRLVRNFYMIIPTEYRALGSLTPHWIVYPLMKYLNRNYYIGLLSAASLYGTTHHQPMIFQVIVDKPMRTIKLPRGGIEFHVKRDCAKSALGQIKAPTGSVNISTKEQTLVDLVSYYKVSGGLDNVALIMTELGEECRPRALMRVIKNESTAVLQRLGYLLEFSNYPQLAKVVERELSKREHSYILLFPRARQRTGEKATRWRLTLNDYVELGLYA